MDRPPPLLAVIIPARNEARTIAACLDSVAAQAWPGRLEVIVIDDGSTDETGAIARARGARVLRTEGVGPSQGRNLAAQQTQAAYCFFTDADCELEPQCLERLFAALEAGGPRIAGTGGRQVVPPDAPPYAHLVQRFFEAAGFVSEYGRTEQGGQGRAQHAGNTGSIAPSLGSIAPSLKEQCRGDARSVCAEKQGIGNAGSSAGRTRTPVPHAFPTSHNPSCCALLRREALLHVGGFREDLWPCEDLELDMRLGRAGYSLLYVPSAVVRHHRPETPQAFRRMMRNYGRGHAHLVKLYGPRRLMHLVPFATLATLGLAPVAAVATAPLWLPLRLGADVVRSGDVPQLTVMLAEALLAWHQGFGEGLLGRSAIERQA